MRAVKYSDRTEEKKVSGVCSVAVHATLCISTLSLSASLFLFPSFAFILSLSPPNLPMKSTLATGNYNEQLHMAAPPAAKIRRGSTAHTHTPPSPILSPSSQNNRLLPNSALIFCVNNTDISPPATMKGGGEEEQRGGRGRRKGLRQERWRRRV